MKKRYLYSLLFGVPGFFFALVMAIGVFGAAAGFLWIFVFGDNLWPASSENALPALFVVTFILVWLAFVIAGFITGKKLEVEGDLNYRHIVISIAATLLPVVLLVMHQSGVGNIGPKSATLSCADYCRDQGYAASGMPPRDSGSLICSCFDGAGREAVKLPLDRIAPSGKR